MITNSYGDLKARRDFYPFGEEINAGVGPRIQNQRYSATADDTRVKFATYQRDIETGLDFAQSRYFSPKLGRFTSPDEFKGGPDELFDFSLHAFSNPTFYADVANPQSLNKYQYAFSNPFRFNDRSGHKSEYVDARAELDKYRGLWENIEDFKGSAENAPRLTGCPRCPVRRPPIRTPIRRPQPPRSPAAVGPMGPILPRSNGPSRPVGPTNVVMVPAGPPNMVRFPGSLVKHHVFPQAGEFTPFFRNAGIDIHSFTVQIPQSQHQKVVHAGIGMGRGGQWNNEWRQFFRTNPNATSTQIYNQANTMLVRFGIFGNLMPYKNPSPSVQAPPK